ncbi:MAG: 3'-5' exoribonuclease, partial [Romboutsia sp.]|nr:3'-5' exoribonuclease [Romboutsia sp.]
MDCEADGSIPHLYSMISLGAVQLDNLENTFYAEMSPISDNYMQQALDVTGFTRVQTLNFRNPESVMLEFKEWLDKIECDRLTFVADNAGFDWSFINYYFYRFLGHNPFGYSPMSITWLYKGLVKDTW